MRILSKRINKTLLVVGAAVAVMIAGVAFADTAPANSIGSVAETIQGSFSNLAKLLTSAAYIMGIGFVIVSLFKFKAHKDNPQQVQIGVPISLLFIGAAMIFLPAVMKTSGATVFGSNATSAGISGISGLS